MTYLNAWIKAIEDDSRHSEKNSLLCLQLGSSKRGDFYTCFKCKKTYEGPTDKGDAHNLTIDALSDHYVNHPACKTGQLEAVKRYIGSQRNAKSNSKEIESLRKEIEDLKLRLKRSEEKFRESDENCDALYEEIEGYHRERHELRQIIHTLIDDYSFTSWKESGYSISELEYTIDNVKHRLVRHALNVPA
jgi:hypothetical protein